MKLTTGVSISLTCFPKAFICGNALTYNFYFINLFLFYRTQFYETYFTHQFCLIFEFWSYPVYNTFRFTNFYWTLKLIRKSLFIPVVEFWLYRINTLCYFYSDRDNSCAKELCLNWSQNSDADFSFPFKWIHGTPINIIYNWRQT